MMQLAYFVASLDDGNGEFGRGFLGVEAYVLNRFQLPR